jgi:lysophospholipase L1-like esterase
MDTPLTQAARLALGGAIALAAAWTATPAPATAAAPMKVAFFGSSTVFGTGASRPDRRWTSLVSRYLGFEELNAGLPGSSVSTAPPAPDIGFKPDFLARWRPEVLNARPDRVLVMGGANDIFRRLPIGPGAGTFVTNYGLLLGGLREHFPASAMVAVTSQPAPDLTRARGPYDAATRAAADRFGVAFIDGTAAFDPALVLTLSADGLHMNDQGHATFASYMAARLTDLGWAPQAPTSTGGSPILAELAPLPGGRLYIDQAAPLTGGELRAVQVAWLGSAAAVVAVMRPDGQGGYRPLYRTLPRQVSRGIEVVAVPRWRVLDGDRLAVWSDGPVVAAEARPSGAGRSLGQPFDINTQVGDVPRGGGTPVSRVLAIRAAAR